MIDQNITCPDCGKNIPLTDALTDKIKHQVQGEMEKNLREKEKILKDKEQLLIKNQKNMESEFAKKLKTEKYKLWEVAQKKATEKIETEFKDLQKSNAEKEIQLKQMRDQELELRKQKRVIEEKEKNMELELSRKIDQERQKISRQAKQEATDEIRLKVAEKDKQMDQMRRTIEDLKRKSEQGSMQIQGDVQENDLKLMLQNSFPMDIVEDVPTGVRGADLIQTVKTAFGQKTGIVIWESKNTKIWSSNWIKKLKDDQSLVKADICILVSQAMPEGIDTFGFKDGVWVCNYKYAKALVGVLRLHLTQINQVRKSMVGKDQKMEILYNYLSGNEFKNRIENIVLAFTGMKSDLETEKRSMQRIWNKREKEIERVIANTSGMYGDLQGIVGASLPTIQSLELPEGEDLEDSEIAKKGQETIFS